MIRFEQQAGPSPHKGESGMLDRRTVVKTGLAASVAAGLARPARASVGTAQRFTHGVASGDPLTDRVILWTRYVPPAANEARLEWEVAEDEGFTTIRRRGVAAAQPARDFTVKVDADGLVPGKRYHFRFRDADGHFSPTGLTRTMPAGRAERLKFAVLSCANLPFGYFNAYAHCAAQDDIDLALHLGDYIYEVPRGIYPTAAEAMAGRLIEPAHEAVALADYRARYASYRSDADLQELHRVKPMIAVWDDHEICNGTWRDGADHHQPATEGTWSDRWRTAYRAFCEWMPVREQAEGIIYRRFDWGDLASLIMLDARFIGRDQPLDYEAALAGVDRSDSDAVAAALQRFAARQLSDPKRSILGQTQEDWLRGQLADSSKRHIPWQILGQQVLFGAMRLPSALAGHARPGLSQRLADRVALRSLVGGHGLPANLESWAGYPAARSRLLADLMAHADNAIILTGDTHNSWAFELPGGPEGRPAAVELGCASVTSPGLETSFRDPAAAASLLLSANPELRWCDIGPRGYLTVDLAPEEAKAEWKMLATTREKNLALAGTAVARLEATRGAGTAKLLFSEMVSGAMP